MAGGRPPKAIGILNLQGTSRPDRHSHRSKEPQSGGKPECPKWLKGDAAKFWRDAVPKLDRMGILQSIDSAELAALCRSWAEWRKSDRRLEAEDDDKVRFRLTILAGMAWKQFEKIATKYGLTPVDRIRLATSEETKVDSPLVQMLKARQGMN